MVGPRRVPEAARVSHDSPGAQAHLRVPEFENTTKTQRENTQREREKKRTKMEWERGKQRNFGRSGGGRYSVVEVTRRGSGVEWVLSKPTTHNNNTTTTQQHTTTTQHNSEMDRPKMNRPNMDWQNWIGKIGLAQSRPHQKGGERDGERVESRRAPV